jgi:hypothetical protein
MHVVVEKINDLFFFFFFLYKKTHPLRSSSGLTQLQELTAATTPAAIL